VGVSSAAQHEPSIDEPQPDEDAVWRALVEPRRRAILRLIADQERAAGDIANEFDVTRTAVSQHLSALKSAGLVSERRDGTRRLYSARREGLAALRILLNDMWATSLNTGRALVEADQDSADQKSADQKSADQESTDGD
jgi:DNA-binding transcriptional ArsR family regulator